ncbi:MAG TPA: phosphatidate cytidylyltransferase [Alphaproteobacteria bacterium]|nr:phosphatidate cytidylyltransferase [Alphaproteobacteria bacterium]
MTLDALLGHLPVNVLWALGGVFAALAVATVVNVLLRRLKPERDWTELGQRIASWWVMAAVFTAAILLSRVASIAFLGFVSFLALKEYLSIIPTRRADRRVLLWAYLAIPIQYYWVASEWYGMFIIFVPVYMFLFLPLPMLIIGQTEGFLRAIGTLHWGLMATVFALSHMAYLLVLPGSEVTKGDGMAAGGAGLLLYLVVLTQFNDVAQYVWGRLFGRSRVIPRISPNKTWAGLIGGFVTTVLLAAALAPYLTPFQPRDAYVAGAIIAAAGFVGDITVSALKRDLGIKDTGSLIPGHGGILDRIDSLTYTAPLFFHFTRYFYF